MPGGRSAAGRKVDASDRFRIRCPAALRTLLELAASQIGNLCNLAEWASVAGIRPVVRG